MIGLVLSLIFGLILMAVGRRWQEAYRSSTTLLFWWNLLVTVFLVIVWISGTVFLAGLGGLVSGSLGFLVGLTGGGLAMSVLLFFMVVMSVIQTLGVLFMYNALELDQAEVYRWKPISLVVGVLFFVVGLSRIFG